MQRRQTPTFLLAVIIMLALAARLGYVWIHEHGTSEQLLASTAGNAYENGLIARSILLGQGFSSPKGGDTGPTAMYVPVYPYFLLPIFKIFGVFTRNSLLAALAVNCGLGALTSIPIFLIGRRWGGNELGLIAALAWALYPSAVAMADLNWTQPASALLTALIVWSTLLLPESETWWHGAAYGALWAFSCLVNPAIFAALPAIAVWLTWKTRASKKHATLGMVAAMVFVAGCFPWTMRNFDVFHQLVPFRSNFGYELWLGNNARVANSWMGSSALLDPLYNPDELRQFEQLHELEYVHRKKEEALKFIRDHAAEEIGYTAHRAATFWTGTWYLSADTSWERTNWKFRTILIFDSVLPLLAFPGVWIAFRKATGDAIVLGSVLLFFPLVYYVTHASTGYRYPIDSLLILLVALGAHEILTRLAQNAASAR